MKQCKISNNDIFPEGNEYNLKNNSIVNIFRNIDLFLDNGIITKNYKIVESSTSELYYFIFYFHLLYLMSQNVYLYTL